MANQGRRDSGRNAKYLTKNLPWLSLTILLAAHSTFSWFLYHATVTWLVWTLAFTFTVLQALLLTTFSQGFRAFLSRWLRSDVGYFTVVITGAFFVTVALVWIQIFSYILVLVSAEILARLDLQNNNFNRLQSLLILSTVSLTGLVIGWVASHYIGVLV